MVTIKEIAEEAEVSITTVSNVLNGKTEKVSPQTIARIQKILKEKNYIPRFGLRTLKNQRSKIIGVLINTPAFAEQSAYTLPFYGRLLGVLESIIRKKGYYMMLYSSKNPAEIETMALGWNMDGILAISVHHKVYQEIAANTGKPIVAIDMDEKYEEDCLECYNITSADYQSGYGMVEFMHQQGIEQIVFMLNVVGGADFRRYHGAADAYTRCYGKELEMVVLGKTYPERVRTYEEYRKLVGCNAALFFSTDLNAAEVVNYYEQHQIHVPEDISVAGCDDDIYAKMCICGLTTTTMDVNAKGIEAVNMLVKLIDGVEVADKNVLIPGTLVERGSVARK